MKCRTALTALVLSALAVGVAAAQARKAGDQIVYDVTVTNGPNKATSNTLTLAVDRVNPDGSAHATATTSSPYRATFEATIASDGEIFAKYNPDLQPPNRQPNEAEMNNVAAQTAQRLPLQEINEIALGCGKREAFNAGDHWRVKLGPSEEHPVGQIIDYTVTGRVNVNGRDAFAVTMQESSGTASSQFGNMIVTATGDYDPAARMVLKLHWDERWTGQSSGSMSLDVSLH